MLISCLLEISRCINGRPPARRSRPSILHRLPASMRSRDSDHGAKELRLAHLALIAILAFVACDNEPKSGGAIPPEAIPIFETYSVPVDTVSGEIWASIPFLKFPIGIVATDEYVAVC